MVDLTGSGYQGGSTITEQYVKTYFQDAGGNLTYKEKLKEIIDAIKLARVRSKPWILSHYLNAIYLGSNAYGVEAAAETYFGRHASQLTVGQAAMLAAMVQEPSGFDPLHPAQQVPGLGYSLLDRWAATLVNMARDTYPDGTPVITQQQLHALVPDPNNPQTALKNFPKIDGSTSVIASWTGTRGYVMQAVRTELENTYGFSSKQLYGAGLRIVTTVSQQQDEGAVFRGRRGEEDDAPVRPAAAVVRARRRDAGEPQERGHRGVVRRPELQRQALHRG